MRLMIAAWLVMATTALAAEPNTLSSEEAQAGFQLLFDGTSLNGWQGDTKGYVAENGVITCKKGQGRNLFTANEYDNFVLRFEFKLTPSANNGLAVRTPLEGNPAYVGMEIQILDDAAEKWAKLEAYQYHGSIYGVVPAKTGALKPAGEWNVEEVVADGSKIKVTLNGQVIVDVDVAGIKELPDGKEHPGLQSPKGYLGFLGHGDEIDFRSIRIKPLH